MKTWGTWGKGLKRGCEALSFFSLLKPKPEPKFKPKSEYDSKSELKCESKLQSESEFNWEYVSESESEYQYKPESELKSDFKVFVFASLRSSAFMNAEKHVLEWQESEGT